MIKITAENLPLDQQLEIITPHALGVTAKVFLHEKARQLSHYHLPVESFSVGVSSEGEEIKIDTLGRWLFGVPGYSGHLRFSTTQKLVVVYYPAQPPAAQTLLLALKKVVAESN